MKLIWLFLFISLVRTENGLNNKCITPHGHIGICMELYSCRHLYSLIPNNSKSLPVRKYLQQSLCGIRYGVRLICCGTPENTNVYEECGTVSDTTVKIFGAKVGKGHFPWMVALQYKEGDADPDFRCAGFLINSQFIMTAAHCLKAKPIYSVHVGISNLTHYEKQEHHKTLKILGVDYHEDYRNDIDDIGLIMVEPVNYTEHVRWICLPKPNASIPDYLILRGWGENDMMIETFTYVLESRFKVIKKPADCYFVKNKRLPPQRIICAGGEVNVDSCRGDSGGALMNKTKYDWTAYGIVSWGSRDCSRGDPAIYTKIQYYSKWLEKTMIKMITEKENPDIDIRFKKSE